MRRLAFLIAVVVIVLSGMGGVLPTHAQGGGSTHTVEKGENLFRIALRYNTTVEALVAANNLSDASHVFVGQVLIIPAAPAQQPTQPTSTPDAATPPPPPPSNNTSAAGPLIYTVQPGET